jgi:hypothetical protein
MESAQQEKISFNATTPTEVDFEGVCTKVVLKTDADVYIAFDRDATDSDLLLETTDLVVNFPVNFTKVSALGASGIGNLSIIGLR